MTCTRLASTTTVGHDDPAVVEASIERSRRRHRETCPDCTCREVVDVTTRRTVDAVADPDGGPVGVIAAAIPIVAVRFIRQPNPEPHDAA